MSKKTVLANVLALGMFLDSMKTWSESKSSKDHHEDEKMKKEKEDKNHEEINKGYKERQ